MTKEETTLMHKDPTKKNYPNIYGMINFNNFLELITYDVENAKRTV